MSSRNGIISPRREVIRLIFLGELKPRREHGNSVLTESDMVRYVWRKKRGLCRS
jgi:hypothetical protein